MSDLVKRLRTRAAEARVKHALVRDDPAIFPPLLDEMVALAGALDEAADRIERLEAALGNLSDAYIALLRAGYDRIVLLGGDCDSVDTMAASDPALIAARAALEDPT